MDKQLIKLADLKTDSSEKYFFSSSACVYNSSKQKNTFVISCIDVYHITTITS